MIKKLLFLVIVLAFFHFGYRVFSYRNVYVSVFDASYWKDRYLKSQWVGPSGCDWDPHINPVTCVWDDAWYAAHPVPNYVPEKRESIGDDGLYAHAGWEYINGQDPTLLNAEIPPLGKYLIGLSIFVFKNQNVFALFSGIFALISLYLVSTILLKDKIQSLIPVALFSFEPLFYTQLRAPFLDLLYLGFLNLTFYFFLKNKFVFSFLFLGLVMATKASISTFGLVMVTCTIFLLLNKKIKDLRKFILLTPVSIIVFLLSYSQFFLLGNSPIEFLQVQKYIINFYATGAKAIYGSVFPMIFSGTWNTWWETVEKVNEWSLVWPIIFSLSLYGVFHIVRDKKNALNLLVIWIIIYIVFLSVIPVWPRYLLLLLPYLYILAFETGKRHIKYLEK